MSYTVNSTHVGTFKRIRAQYIAAAGGLALAVTALIGAAAITLDDGSTRNVPAVSADRSTEPFYPLVQEQSHPQIAPAAGVTDTVLPNGTFPLVQEMSHPVVPAAAPPESLPENGSYPLVQEMSHPR